jgi:uncharacterized protein YbcI
VGEEPSTSDHASGGELLTRISNEIVRAQKHFFGKGPTSAKSYMLDDLLLVVMRGSMTTAERSMIEFGQQDEVRQFRQVFENEMTERLVGIVEQLTGRKVLGYQSQIVFEPDVVVELFVFDADASADARAATGRGQLEDHRAGQATDQRGLDPGD